MPIYPTVDAPTGKSDPLFNRKTMPACQIRRDVKSWHMWTTLSGINASNYASYIGSSPQTVEAREAKIQASLVHMMNLYHNFRKVKLEVEYSIDGNNSADSWSYAGYSAEPPTKKFFSGTVTNEDVNGEGATDPLTEGDVVNFLTNTAGGFLEDEYGNTVDDLDNPYYIDEFVYIYPNTGRIDSFSDDRPPPARVPCPSTSLNVSGSIFFEPSATYNPFFEALYYDGIFLGYAVRYITSWDQGWLITDTGVATGTQATLILGGAIQSDSTTSTSSLTRNLAYVDFPSQNPNSDSPKMICEATGVGFQSRTADAAGLTSSGTTLRGDGAFVSASNTIYSTGYGNDQDVWFWEYN